MGLRVSNCLCTFVPVLPSNKGAVGFWWEKWSFRFFAKGLCVLRMTGLCIFRAGFPMHGKVTVSSGGRAVLPSSPPSSCQLHSLVYGVLF